MPQGYNLHLGTQNAANLVNNNADPDSSGNPMVQVVFDISNATPVQYVIIGDGQLENPNERLEIAPNATTFTHSLLASHTYHMRLIQKASENQPLANATYSKFDVVPLAGPGKGKITQVESFDKAFRITVDYNGFDKEVNSPIDSITFLLSEASNNDVFEITKSIPNMNTNTFTLSNLDLSGQDVSFSNFLNYDINFFTTDTINGVTVNGPISDASMASPIEKIDRPGLLQATQSLANFDEGKVTLKVRPPVDVTSGEIPGSDISNITFEAVLATDVSGFDSANVISYIETSANIIQDTNNFNYPWEDAIFNVASTFYFRIKYLHVNGEADLDASGNPLVYSGKELYSDVLEQTTFSKPLPIATSQITAASDLSGISLTFSWTKNTDLSGTIDTQAEYDIVLKRYDDAHDVSNIDIDASNNIETVTSTSATSYTFGDANNPLKNGVRYYIVLSQSNSSPNELNGSYIYDISADAVTSIAFQPVTSPGQMAAPTLVQTNQGTEAGSLTATWAPLLSNNSWETYLLGGHTFKHYKVQLFSSNVVGPFTTSTDISTNLSHKFSNLDLGKEYTAKVTLVATSESDTSNVLITSGTTEVAGLASTPSNAVHAVGPLGQPTQTVMTITGDISGNETHRDIEIQWKTPNATAGAGSAPGPYGGVSASDLRFNVSYDLCGNNQLIEDLSAGHADIAHNATNDTYIYTIDLSGLEPEDEITNVRVNVEATNPTSGQTPTDISSAYIDALVFSNASGYGPVQGTTNTDLSYVVYAQPEPPTRFDISYSYVAADVSSVELDVSRGEITLSWTAPTDINGRPLSTTDIYEINIYEGTDTTGTLFDVNSYGYTKRTIDTSYTVTLPKQNTTYFATVAARNLAGYSSTQTLSGIRAVTNPLIVKDSEFDILYDANTESQDAGSDSLAGRKLYITFLKSIYETRDTGTDLSTLKIAIFVNNNQESIQNISTNLVLPGERYAGDKITLKVQGRDNALTDLTSAASTSKDILGAYFPGSSTPGTQTISFSAQTTGQFTSNSGTINIYEKNSAASVTNQTIESTDTSANFIDLSNNTGYYAVLHLASDNNSVVQEYSKFFMVAPIPRTVENTNVTITDVSSGTLRVSITDFADDSGLDISSVRLRYKRHDETAYGAAIEETTDSSNNHTFNDITDLSNGHVYNFQVSLGGISTAINPLTGVITTGLGSIAYGNYNSTTKDQHPSGPRPILRTVQRNNEKVTLKINSQGLNIVQVHFIPGYQDDLSMSAVDVTQDISGIEVTGDGDDTNPLLEEFTVEFTLTGYTTTADLNTYVAIVDADDGSAVIQHTYNQDLKLGPTVTHNWDTENNQV